VSELAFNEDVGKQLEAAYQVRDAIRRRRLVRAALGATAGDRILDVGCGPGFYCAELLEEVGPDGRVVGLDMSSQMLVLAERRCAGYDTVEPVLLHGDTLDLTAGVFHQSPFRALSELTVVVRVRLDLVDGRRHLVVVDQVDGSWFEIRLD
jgi:SAM-dependent methyltransferase